MAHDTSAGSGVRVRRPSAPSQNRCQKCGAFVTPQFARVFGNNVDEVYGCFTCLEKRAVRRGAARVGRE
ncbi:DUF7563 family protein [Haladaptatus halobius]|jgi:hypothetical protein|uniref:DUF7563 family protein n=1 Tax=Haladaptatus halobius TaxID=2884875 RepID=UPI001D0B3592|nr:hypothetical protein [Haladaptatus halobius]